MLCCNLSVSLGLTNGSTGTVLKFDSTHGIFFINFIKI